MRAVIHYVSRALFGLRLDKPAEDAVTIQTVHEIFSTCSTAPSGLFSLLPELKISPTSPIELPTDTQLALCVHESCPGGDTALLVMWDMSYSAKPLSRDRHDKRSHLSIVCTKL